MIIGIYSPGEMGSVVGRVLRENGLRVIACLEGRSDRTRQLTADAGIETVPDYATLVDAADIILSILVPAEAEAAAQRLAEMPMDDVLYADCNAIAPATTTRIEALITEAGGRFVDASIIGPPPRKPGLTRIYASGEEADTLAHLNDYGLDIRVLGDAIGQASAIKMCYAALTKGLAAMAAELFVGAEALGVREALQAEFGISQSELLPRLERAVRYVPAKSRRFAGEMDEIAQTFGDVGLPPEIHQGTAAMYRLIGATHLADRNPEDPTPPPDLETTLTTLVKHIQEQL